jgi:hypothetical protein
MITTTTIEQLCCYEDGWDNDERLEWLEQMLDGGHFGILEREFAGWGEQRFDLGERLQLQCEAIKFHRLRVAGHTFHEALDRMIGAAHA